MIPIVVLGTGGHAQSVIDVIECQQKYEVIFAWDQFPADGSIFGYPINNQLKSVDEVLKECPRVVIGIGQIKEGFSRRKIYESIKNFSGQLPNIISPFAYISKHACLGEGNVVMHSAMINANAKIGNNCIINTGATIEHGVKVENHCHISTGAILNGECVIGEGAFIGSNATIRQKVRIASDNVIGAGAVVLNNTKPGGVYVGNPARRRQSL